MIFPSNPSVGDTFEVFGNLYFYNGISWSAGFIKQTGGKLIIGSPSQPTTHTAGDLWLDPATKVIKASNGTTFVALSLVNPPPPGPFDNYNGWVVGLSQIYGNEPNINQLIIAKVATAPTFQYVDDEANTNVDDFGILGTSEIEHIAIVTLFGSDVNGPIDVALVTDFAREFIDNVMRSNGADVTSASTAKNNFFNNYNTFIAPVANVVVTNDQTFEFFDREGFYGPFNVVENTSSGAGFSVSGVIVNQSGQYEVQWNSGADSGYQLGDTFTISGDQLGGTSPENDVVVTVTSMDASHINGATFAGTPAYDAAYPVAGTNNSGNEYDNGNYVVTSVNQTNLNNVNNTSYDLDSIPYADGLVQTGSNSAPYFGGGSEYVACFNGSVFAMMAFNCNGVTEAHYSGDTGSNVYGSKEKQNISGLL